MSVHVTWYIWEGQESFSSSIVHSGLSGLPSKHFYLLSNFIFCIN